ncbi:MAG: SufB/SufD family protein [Candidatus Dormibacteria bacterium]
MRRRQRNAAEHEARPAELADAGPPDDDVPRRRPRVAGMTEAPTTTGAISREAVDALVARSPAWLAARRTAAWDAFTALPVPSSARDEDWRRTDISKLHVDRFGASGPAGDGLLDIALARHAAALPGSALVLCGPDGTVTVENAESLLAQGVIVSSLEEAALLHPELVQRGLAGIGVGESYFTALWNALWRGGAFIHVPPGVHAMTPVWVGHLAAGGDAMSLPGTVVVVDEHSSLTLVEDLIGPPDPSPRLSVAVTALRLADESRLEDIPVQQLPSGTWHFTTRRASLGAAARYRLLGATLGARVQKAYWDVLLEGAGAEADVLAVCFADAEQHLDHQSLQLHRAPDTRSNLLLKVAARGRAQSVYGGLIDVEPGAIHADGYVVNRNLLLSHGAGASGVPRLEIKANDVRCGHGTTVGHVDDEERFYLMARGIPAGEADRLVVRGYFADVLDRLPVETAREWLVSLLDAEIGATAVAGQGAEP